MFNLTVTNRLENEHSGLISVDRVFEHTCDDVVGRFMSQRKLDTAAVILLPTIFMEKGDSDEVAGIGWLSQVQLRGRDYQLRYTLDRQVPRMTNADICALASQLQIENFEFSRNH